MKSVLIAIRPQWVEKIASGQKTIEVRKTAPQEVPFKAYIYCTFPKKPAYTLWLNRGTENKFLADGKVIGEFICDKVYPIKNRGSSFSVADEEQSVTNEIAGQSCLYYDDMVSYFGNKDGFGWRISDLKIYDRPKKLSEFRKSGFMTEEEWLFNLYPNTHCHYEAWAKKFEITCAPQSWMYIEGLREE